MAWLGPKTQKHKHVIANLRMVCPEKSPEEIHQLAIEAWGNLGAVLAEFPHLKKLGRDPSSQSIELIDINQDQDFLSRKKPFIFVAAHLGNWEVAGYAIQTNGFPIDLVYSPFDNVYLEKMVQARRAFMGAGFITKQNALRRMYSNLRKGRSVGLHVDVRVDDGDLFPFFGADATTTTAPAWLALKAGIDIIPVVTERLEGSRFRVFFHPAIKIAEYRSAPKEEAIRAITTEMNRVIAGFIRSHPEHWLCTKRRWPKDVMKELGVY
jgi:KDO2-lipid IV(A) lauroyltransferase